MSTFDLQSGDNSNGPWGTGGPFGGVGSGEGFYEPAPPYVTNGCGGATPDPPLIGPDRVCVCAHISDPGPGPGYFVVTITNGALLQNAFASLSFVNKNGVTETYLTVDATFANPQVGYSEWIWNAQSSFPFANGLTYTITVLGAVDPVYIAVPGVVSETLAQATSDIQAAGLIVGTITGAEDPAVPGTIINQSPAAGAQAIVGSAVDLTESLGPILLQATFVPASNFKAIMVANPGAINPRIYPPYVDTTVRVKS